MEDQRAKMGSRALADAGYLQIRGDPPQSRGMTEHIGILEEQIKAVASRQSYLVEEERANRQRVEGTLKIANEQTAIVVNDLANKVAILQNALGREQEDSAEIIAKLRQSEQANKDLHGFLQAMQMQTDKEMAQLRDAINERLGDSQADQARNKEKNSALFAEVVRIGQELERLSGELPGSVAQLDSKLREVEAKSDKAQQAASSTDLAGGNFADMLSRYSERTETRLAQLEAATQSIVVLCRANQELEIGKGRTGERGEAGDICGPGRGRPQGVRAAGPKRHQRNVSSLANENSGRVETGLADLQNRLKMEQEDRQRLAEDLKHRIEIRGKMEGDQTKADKLDFCGTIACRENIRDSYRELDAIIKNEITRREEVLRNMENSFDGQLKALQAQVRKEEIGRAQQELVLKSDITKLAEQLRTDYELFKSQQNQLTGKITEMIKLEVETRLVGEKENKAVTEAIFRKFVDDMNLFRDAVEKQNRRFAKDLKELSTESSERANSLSRYVEDVAKKHAEAVDGQLQKIKLLCAKLTEQVKEHFQSTERTIAEIKQTHAEDVAEIKVEVSEYKDRCEKEHQDLGVRCELDRMLSITEAENVYRKMKWIYKESQDWRGLLVESMAKLQKSVQDSDKKCSDRTQQFIAKTQEDVDRKIQATLEKLKKANLDLWNTSLQLSEKRFSREGVREVLELVPPQVMAYPDIKYALNQLGSEGVLRNPKPRVMIPDFATSKNGKAGRETKANVKAKDEKRESEPGKEETKKEEKKKDEEKGKDEKGKYEKAKEMKEENKKEEKKKKEPQKNEEPQKKEEPQKPKASPKAAAKNPPEEKKPAAPATKPKEEKKAPEQKQQPSPSAPQKQQAKQKGSV